jgi:cytochrome c1
MSPAAIEAVPPRHVAPLVLGLMLLGACERDGVPAEQRVFDGSPEFGRVLMAEHGCTACHAIPGVDGFSGSVGPPGDGFGRRASIAGGVPDGPMLLTAWLRDPPAIDPATLMPAMGLSEPEARDMAAYLYTLR